MSLSSLIKETSFAMRSTQNWRSRSALLTATGRFHFNNRCKMRAPNLPAIDVDLDFGGGRRSVRLRQHSGDIFIFYEVLAFGAYDLPASVIDPTSVRTIMDCGGNIGMTALYWAQRYPHARIFSIEPEPENFALLKHNTAGIDRIIPVQAAVVGAAVKSVRFSTDKPAWGNGIVDTAESSSTVDVPALTVDELMARFDLRTIDLLKVDIEGGEGELFSRPQFLSKVRLVAIELHGDYTLEKFSDAVRPMAFEARDVARHLGLPIVTARPADTAVASATDPSIDVTQTFRPASVNRPNS